MIIKQLARTLKTGKIVITYELRCDYCSIEFKRLACKVGKKQFHFHSKKCADLASLPGGIIAKKRHETSLERYGTDYPQQSPIVREKTIATNRERYGCDVPLQNKEVMQRSIDTCQERYKVNSPLDIPHVRAATTSHETRKKAHKTQRKNGTLKTSHQENIVHGHLCDIFGAENVERQAPMGHWPIDFCVTRQDGSRIFIQYDGSYFHGHGVPLGDLFRQARLENRWGILVKVMNDIAQRQHADEHDLLLVRISEDEFKHERQEGGDAALAAFIKDRITSAQRCLPIAA